MGKLVGRHSPLLTEERFPPPTLGQNLKLPDNPPPPNPAYLLKAVGASLGSATAPYTSNDCARTSALPGSPTLNSGGIVALNTVSNMIQAGSWISIYGTNLATSTAQWKGDFPTSLDGTSVTINSKPAYLWFVSPGQINLQVPDDTATGGVNVVVTTPNGIVSGTVLLVSYSPSFSLLDSRHAAAIVIRTDGSGAYGGGAYDVVGPTGSPLGYKTVAAKPGDNVVLYGLGFGATNPSVPAGKPFSGAAPTTNSVSLLINNVLVPTMFVGLVSPGLYQFNFRVPTNLGAAGELALVGQVGTTRSPLGVVFTVE